jgi:hypothetical protein
LKFKNDFHIAKLFSCTISHMMEDRTNDYVSNGVALQRTDILLAHIGQWGVEYTDITFTRNIQRAMSRNPHKSQKRKSCWPFVKIKIIYKHVICEWQLINLWYTRKIKNRTLLDYPFPPPMYFRHFIRPDNWWVDWFEIFDSDISLSIVN